MLVVRGTVKLLCVCVCVCGCVCVFCDTSETWKTALFVPTQMLCEKPLFSLTAFQLSLNEANTD